MLDHTKDCSKKATIGNSVAGSCWAETGDLQTDFGDLLVVRRVVSLDDSLSKQVIHHVPGSVSDHLRLEGRRQCRQCRQQRQHRPSCEVNLAPLLENLNRNFKGMFQEEFQEVVQ